jgi:hypothetical protein
MKYTVHIWKSIDPEGKYFSLRLRPTYSAEQSRFVETFRTERSLSRRLSAIGFTEDLRRKSFASLHTGNSAMWSHLEIPEHIFATFGRSVGRTLFAA